MAEFTEITGLVRFTEESNRIEGIVRASTDDEIAEAERFITLPEIHPTDVVKFVSVYQPDARLRDQEGLNVRVGPHVPPSGGVDVFYALCDVLDRINANAGTPYLLHRAYEELHPFTDGNGRSGRILWAWQMMKFSYPPGLQLGFLHAFYYQSLQAPREDTP